MNESGRLCLQILRKTSYFCSCKWIVFFCFILFYHKINRKQWNLQLKNAVIAS